MASDLSVEGVLARLVDSLVAVLPIDAVGVTLLAEGSHPCVVAASDPRALRHEHRRHEHRQHESAEPGSQTARATVLCEEGLGASSTLPLHDGDLAVGSVSLHRVGADPLGEADAAAARTLADVATVFLLHARARAELEAVAAREHDALGRLRQLVKEKDEYLATVLHELRTPMTSIAGYAEMLQDSDLTEDQRRLLDAVIRNSERLSTQAEDLLALLSLEHGSIKHEHVELDLRAVLAAARATLEPLLVSRDLEVDFDVPDTTVLVLGDPGELERAVTNLVTNAVKFTDDPGRVQVSLRRRGRAARIEVSDDGIGIPKAEQAHLFTRFFRSSTAQHRAIPGSGLGLTIVQAIVHAHAGTITVDSDEGRGTRFVVDLPATAT